MKCNTIFFPFLCNLYQPSLKKKNHNKLLRLKFLMPFMFCFPFIFSIKVILLAEFLFFAPCSCANCYDASCPANPVRVLIKGWFQFPIYVLQCCENVVTRTYLGVSVCIVSVFLAALITYCHKRGTYAFDLQEMVPRVHNTDLQDERGNFIAGLEDDLFYMTFKINLL